MAHVEIPQPKATVEPGGGCNIEWGWLAGEEIDAAGSDLQNFVIHFKSGLTLKIQALLWNGQPFLGFDPYQPPPEALIPQRGTAD